MWGTYESGLRLVLCSLFCRLKRKAALDSVTQDPTNWRWRNRLASQVATTARASLTRLIRAEELGHEGQIHEGPMVWEDRPQQLADDAHDRTDPRLFVSLMSRHKLNAYVPQSMYFFRQKTHADETYLRGVRAQFKKKQIHARRKCVKGGQGKLLSAPAQMLCDILL